MHGKSSVCHIKSLISFIFISTLFSGCAFLAGAGEEVVEDIIEEEVEKEEIRKQVNPRPERGTQKKLGSQGSLVSDRISK
jgi:hypothetical protein